MAKATVILSFYNKIDVLKLVLTSLEYQSENDFEVVIADDGSSENVVNELNFFIENSPLTIKHCWHPDNDWQKNKILNSAVRMASSNYFIFVDADCLLHQHFVREHLRYAKEKVVLTGRRVNLSEKTTRKLTIDRIKKGYLSIPILIDSLRDGIFGKARDVEQGIYLGKSWLGTWLNRKDKGVLGSNFSITENDFYAVNGFDERFAEPAAGEDTDIEHRLERNNCKILTVRNRAIQYHIYHKELPRKESRLRFLEENDKNQVIYTPYGIIRDS